MVFVKRYGIPALAAGLILICAVLSVVHVPTGRFAIAGSKELGPGWRVKPFWLRARLYADPVTLTETLSVQTREGARKEAKAAVTFSWDRERLHGTPSGEAEARTILLRFAHYAGPSLKTDIEKAFSGLPIRGLSVLLDTEGDLPDAVKAAWHPTHRKVIFLGLDALDWMLMDKLIAEGRMPAFARLKREGAWASLESFKPTLSPLIWTSIATSRPPEEHGVLEFVINDPATGRMAPITSNYRKVQAFWDILSAFKLKVNVVGWWATFPAEKINGTMISERLFFSLFGIETARDFPGNTYPADAERRFKPLMVNAADIGYPEVRQYAHLPEEEFRRIWEEGKTESNPFSNRINHLRKILAVTHSVVNISKALLEQPSDVTAIYIEGTDTIGHRFGHLMPPKLPRVSQEDFQMGRDAMPRYYEEMDRVLTELMNLAPPDTLWIIASDHGFYTGEARPASEPDDFTTGAPEWHRLTGVLLMHGPGIRKGEIANATVYDLIPTLFYALGIPVSREMKGRALKEAFSDALPAETVASYEFLPAPWKEQKTSAPDEERVKELQALGYIGGSGGPSATQASSAPGAPAEDSTQLYNTANSLYEKGNLDGAMELYRKAVEIKPDFGMGMFALAQCFAMKKDHAQAYDWLKRSLQHPKMLPPKVLVHLADEAKEAGRTEDALAFLQAQESVWRRESSYFTALGILRAAHGNEAEAVSLFEQSLRMRPDNAVAAEELLKRSIEQNDPEKAQALLRHAWKAAEGSIQTMNYLGIVCLRNGQGKIAEGIFRKVLESDSENAGVLANLAIALQMQGKSRDAASVFEKTVRLQPDNAQLYYNYGACLAELGNHQRALEIFLKARNLNFQNPKLFIAIAKVYFRLNRVNEAKEILREALKTDPGFAEARDLLEALEKERP